LIEVIGVPQDALDHDSGTDPHCAAIMNQTPFDLIATWQRSVSDWERQMNEASARLTGTEEFSQAMNQASKFSLAARQQLDKQIEEWLKLMHLPSKADLVAIQDRLAAIEEGLAQIKAALADKAPKKAGPTRTRRPPGKG
jgi:hypothetical protein